MKRKNPDSNEAPTSEYPLKYLIIRHLNELSVKPAKKSSNNDKPSMRQLLTKSQSRLAKVAIVPSQCERIRINMNKRKKKIISCENASMEETMSIHRNTIQVMDIPAISSRYWGVYELKTQKFIWGKQSKKQIQVASLTKIMNLFTIITIIQSFSLNPKLIKISVSQWASNVIGTSASLKKNDVLSLEDLFYGMMLPSGNDAAFQIALIGGTILRLADYNNVKKIYERLQVEPLTQCKSNSVRYLLQMNKISKKIGMLKSKWVNPHGLSNKQNRTTVEDMCILCQTVMQNQYIRRIVNTKHYQCKISSQLMSNTDSRVIVWQNTNKMLWKGWNGIKTGVTPNAGPCLAASLPINEENENYQFLVIIANCMNMEQRWNQVQIIAEWAASKFKSMG